MNVSRKTQKILLYSINFTPELTGIGKYNGEMVRWLTSQGYEVRVVTVPPYYPQWKVQSGYSAGKYRKEQIDGAEVWRCPVWVPRQASGLKRIMHLASFAVSSLPVMLVQMLWRPQLMLVVEPPLAISPAALILAKIFRIKAWLHVQDFEVDAAFDLGLLPKKKFLKAVITGMESKLMQGFNRVSTISQPMLSRLQSKRVPDKNLVYFPNWVDTTAIYPLPEQTSFRRELGLDQNDFIVLYSGNMGAKQGLEILLDAAEKLQPYKRIQFLLCGDGQVKETLIQLAAKRKLTNIRFLPLQPLDKLNELLNTADVHTLIQKQSISDLVMPSKLTGMLASGRPVIATAEEDTAVYNAIMEAEAGWLVPPGDAEGLAECLLRMCYSKSTCSKLGRQAREYAVRELSMESIMKDFEVSFSGMFDAGQTMHEERLLER
ncbi:glycosyltransferase WbuB [Paenibacillus eucommiae]|uniref:Colanic acid biosynthesis glycosyl transferase WcaI n=1 Tax=Paenibacillus eucommiae TaxID=1355755 RepID=A0ABS4J2B3_9BACL|nr:glycosyltransferase WbuB [Paenibacillus eucommiae]MBP1993981.1 colanic acid biosynthesis glycosyl transferase WcaI [Paenibacillus eucommiae]